jgi:hypothetical protein
MKFAPSDTFSQLRTLLLKRMTSRSFHGPRGLNAALQPIYSR